MNLSSRTGSERKSRLTLKTNNFNGTNFGVFSAKESKTPPLSQNLFKFFSSPLQIFFFFFFTPSIVRREILGFELTSKR